MVNAKEKQTIDLRVFIAEAIAVNKKAYKVVDQVVENKKACILSAIASNPEWRDIPLCKDGTIEKEDYFLKAMALIEDESLHDDLELVLKKTYKDSYNYVTSITKFSLTKFCEKITKKYTKGIPEDIFNGYVDVAVMCAINQDKLDVSDEFYEVYIKGRVEYLNRITCVENDIDYKALDKLEKKIADKIEIKLRQAYFPYGYGPNYFLITSNVKDGQGIDLRELKAYERFLLAREFVEDNEKLSTISIVGDDILKIEDIKDLIAAFMRTNMIENINDVSFDELAKFIVSTGSLVYYMRAYKKAKKKYFEQYDEDNLKTIKALDKDNSELREALSERDRDLDKIKVEYEELMAQKRKLEAELSALDSYRKELVELRQFVFSLNDVGEEDVEVDTIDIDKLNEAKVVCFGGRNKWIEVMKEKLPLWTFVPVEAINFDTNILLGADYVFINTTKLSHGIYYKIIENIDSRSSLRYINVSNYDRTIDTIVKSW